MAHRVNPFLRTPTSLLAACAAVLILGACRNSHHSAPSDAAAADTTACSPARAHPTGNTNETISSNGVDRHYILHVPLAYDGSKRLPLVFNLHGAGSNAIQQSIYSGLPSKSDTEGFILITPDGMGTPRQWNFLRLKTGADDVGFIRELLGRTEAELCVDQTRVYATGISSGGAMSVSLACALQDRITAVAPVAALYYPPNCPMTRAVPLIEFHGTDDKIVPFEGGTVAGSIPGLPSPNVERAAAAWAKADGCGAAPENRQFSEHVRFEAYGACRDGVAVQLYVIDGGGHVWPGSPFQVTRLGETTPEVSATDVIWQFFASQPPLPGAPQSATPPGG